ncbi:MAG: hypothetical protein GXO61_04995 [Epsilonproteobacteria bacterium]|nr:hypothetical protein [Campylobacterota bacterium]
MVRFALFLVLLFLVAFYKIYSDYKGDRKKFILDISLLLFLLGATAFTQYARIYLPLLVIHLLLLIVGWGYFYLYLFGKAKKIIYIFTPLISIVAFFVIGMVVSRL